MQEYEQLGHINRVNEDAVWKKSFITLHITRFWRVPAVQHALVLFLILICKVSFQFILQSVTNYTRFAAMVSDPFSDGFTRACSARTAVGVVRRDPRWQCNGVIGQVSLRLPVSRSKVRCIVTVVVWRHAAAVFLGETTELLFLERLAVLLDQRALRLWNWLYANQPTNERGEDGDLIKAQVNVRRSFQPFLRFTASLGSEADTLNYNWGCMYANECSSQFKISTWTN